MLTLQNYGDFQQVVLFFAFFFSECLATESTFGQNSKSSIQFWPKQWNKPLFCLWFLNNNGILYHEDGSKRLADNTLVALTLMIAESKTEEKDVMVKVVVNLINQKNI